MPIDPTAILALTGGLGNSISGAITSKRNTDRTIRANRELAEYAYSKDLEMWNRQNLYNSPEAQMSRLKGAGLNPNLVYGTGATANTSGSMPHYNAPTAQYNYKPVELTSALSAYQDFQMRQAQIDNVKAQTSNVKERTFNESLRRWILDIQGRTGEFDLDRRKNLAPFQQQAAEAGADTARTHWNVELQKLRNMQHDEQLKVLEKKYRAANLTTQQIDQEKKEAELLYQQFRNEWMKMGITNSDSVIFRILIRMFNEVGVEP